MLNTFILLAEDANEIKSGYGGLIFMCLFVLGSMGVAIWWLRR